MSRLMSVAMTKQAVIERRKTVTRRKNWWLDKNGRRILKVGDRLTLCEKVQGRKPGEPIVRLAEVEVVSVSREQLFLITQSEVMREGFPGMSTNDFIAQFFKPQGIDLRDEITRIEWRYLE